MKKLYFLLLLLPSLAFATSFPGNGATGFGGGVGQSTLNITDDGSVISFQLVAGAGGFSGNNLVIYIDNLQGGGYSNTSTFTDNADGGRTAISGFNLGNPSRTQINFPAGFTPQMAISVDYGFVGLFSLSNPANFTFITSGNLSAVGNTLTFSFNKSTLGIPGSVNFKFFGTLISTSAYRSNEAIGSVLTDPAPAPPNYAFTGTINPATVDTYSGTILAVALEQFNGTKQGANTLLQWRTAGEEGLNYFSVQQSVDGINWYDVSTTAATNSSTGNGYSSTVANKPAPVNYYRLKMVNRDGSATYSRIITIKTTGLGNIDILNTLVQNELKFVVNSSMNANIKVYVYSTDGRVILSKDYRSAGGSTLYSLPADQLHTGIYILRIIAGDESASFKFLKQ